jgi:hypothetical protein
MFQTPLTAEDRALLRVINNTLIDNEVSLEMVEYHETVGRTGVTLGFDVRSDWTLRLVIEANDLEKIEFLRDRRVKLFDTVEGFVTRRKLYPEDSTGGFYVVFAGLQHGHNYYYQIDR